MATEAKTCGANLRNKPGKKCGASRGLYPNGRCRLHGGGSLGGLAHPNFKHGRFSLKLPSAWGDLEAKVADPELRSITLDLIAVDERMGDILARVGTLKGDSAKARAMEEFVALSAHRSTLLTEESRRMSSGQASIPEAQARLLLRSLSIAVKEEAEAAEGTTFDSRVFLMKLRQRFDRLTGRSRLRVVDATAESVKAG